MGDRPAPWGPASPWGRPQGSRTVKNTPGNIWPTHSSDPARIGPSCSLLPHPLSPRAPRGGTEWGLPKRTLREVFRVGGFSSGVTVPPAGPAPTRGPRWSWDRWELREGGPVGQGTACLLDSDETGSRQRPCQGLGPAQCPCRQDPSSQKQEVDPSRGLLPTVPRQARGVSDTCLWRC